MKTILNYILLVLICMLITPANAVQYTLKTNEFQSVNTMVERKQQTNQSYQQSYNQYRNTAGVQSQNRLNGVSHTTILFRESDAQVHSVGVNYGYYSNAYNLYHLNVSNYSKHFALTSPRSLGFSNISRQNFVEQQASFVEQHDAEVMRQVERPDEPPIGELEPIGDCPIGFMILLLAAFAIYIGYKNSKKRLLKD